MCIKTELEEKGLEQILNEKFRPSEELKQARKRLKDICDSIEFQVKKSPKR